ncbi:hypothetical protein JKP88DRAFT_245713 [Tribonema minus]|uniref:Uncharacterized protein n=1 Tax=Tribonema minus TaxID=303371 RepID=A0A835Z4T1_9STRA|nr:hypothetical protein JKP88DRAFT_245713 [Tribonema minus]
MCVQSQKLKNDSARVRRRVLHAQQRVGAQLCGGSDASGRRHACMCIAVRVRRRQTPRVAACKRAAACRKSIGARRQLVHHLPNDYGYRSVEQQRESPVSSVPAVTECQERQRVCTPPPAAQRRVGALPCGGSNACVRRRQTPRAAACKRAAARQKSIGARRQLVHHCDPPNRAGAQYAKLMEGWEALCASVAPDGVDLGKSPHQLRNRKMLLIQVEAHLAGGAAVVARAYALRRAASLWLRAPTLTWRVASLWRRAPTSMLTWQAASRWWREPMLFQRAALRKRRVPTLHLAGGASGAHPRSLGGRAAAMTRALLSRQARGGYDACSATERRGRLILTVRRQWSALRSALLNGQAVTVTVPQLAARAFALSAGGGTLTMHACAAALKV